MLTIAEFALYVVLLLGGGFVAGVFYERDRQEGARARFSRAKSARNRNNAN